MVLIFCRRDRTPTKPDVDLQTTALDRRAALRCLRCVALVLVLMAGVAPLLSVSARASEPPRVVVTIKPIHSLVAGLLDGIAAPELLVRGAASPHGYALRPSDARAAYAADMLIGVSGAVEPFLPKLMAAVPAATTTVVLMRDITGLTVLNVRDFKPDVRTRGTASSAGGAGATAGPDEHEHDPDHHGHEHGEASDSHTPGSADPHIWLSPTNARAIVLGLSAKMQQRFPAHRAVLVRNEAAVLAEIETLKRDLADRVRAVRGRPFIVLHDAFQYFEDAFGLTAIGAIAVRPDIAPGARRLSVLRQTVLASGAVCVFREPQFPSRIITTLTEGTRVKIGLADPIGAELKPGPALYGTLMHQLADSFAACLASNKQ